MMCDKANVLDDMIMCHSCGDMSLCLHCCFASHDGHEREKLHNHMDNQVKQLQQWQDDKLPIIHSLTFPSTVFDSWKAFLDQHQARQQKAERKQKDFQYELHRLIDTGENELNASNGYKFEFASFEEQLQAIQDEHKECKTKRQRLKDALSKTLQSGDFSGVGHSGILLSDGFYYEFYSPITNSRQLVFIDTVSRRGGVMGVLRDGRVMVAGGDCFGPSTASEIIDLVTNQVVQSPSMATRRCNASSAMIDGEMYVCGGIDGGTLSSCEVYRDGKWMPIANMKVPRAGHSVVALNGLLYAMGGYDTSPAIPINSVECYSPETDSWQLVASLKDRCPLYSAAAFNGRIYFAGGYRGRASDKVCERYNPNQNQWEKVADMNKGRVYFSLVPFGDKLYAIGGFFEDSVESYDALKNEWKMVEDITLKAQSVQTVVVNYNP